MQPGDLQNAVFDKQLIQIIYHKIPLIVNDIKTLSLLMVVLQK